MKGAISFRLQIAALLNVFALALAADAVHGRASSGRPRPKIEVGEVAGAEYDPMTNRFLLYAKMPAASNASVLYAEDVARLAAAIYRFGGYDFSLEHGPKYMEIRYFPPQAGEHLGRLFRGSKIEATFNYTDGILKDLGHGEKVGDGLRTGASELVLCRTQLCQSPGLVAPDFTTVYVVYFELEVQPSTEGLCIWLREPRLRVRAATRRDDMPLPECVARFAENLSSNAAQLLVDKKIGAEFRRLKTLLLVAQALGWARRAFVPVDVERLEEYAPVRNSPARAIPVREYPILCRDPSGSDKVRNMSVQGGIALHPAGEASSLFGAEKEAEQGNSTMASAGAGVESNGRVKPVVTGFLVERVIRGGHEMLRIDVSGCLGLEGRIQQ